MTTNHYTLAPFLAAFQRKGRLTLCLALCMLGLSSTASAQEGRIITFDAPFADLKPGDYNGTYPTSINDSGAITGYSNDANYVSHSFLRSPDGTITTFQAPGADIKPADAEGTIATGINALGAITDTTVTRRVWCTGSYAVATASLRPSKFQASGGYGSFPIAINLEGAIVGYYTDSNYAFHAFLRSPDGKFTTWIGPDACTGTVRKGARSGASNINAFGIIAGGFEDNSGNFVDHEPRTQSRRQVHDVRRSRRGHRLVPRHRLSRLCPRPQSAGGDRGNLH